MTSKLQVDIILAVHTPSNKKSPLECHMVPIHNLLHTPPPVKVRLSSSQLIETYRNTLIFIDIKRPEN